MNTIKVDYEKACNLMCIADAVDKFIFDEFNLIIVDADKRDSPPFVVDILEGTNVFKFMIPFIRKGKPKYMAVKVDRDALEYDLRLMEEFIAYVGDYSKAEKLTHIFCDIIRSVTYYIMNIKRNRKEVHSVPRKYSREHRLSTSHNKIYLLDDIIKYVHDNYVPQGGHHEIKCPSWEVRGHYRHYKSGKTVFIRAYKKGKQRDKVAPKEKEYYA